jgi:hypothetical protein
MIQVYVNFCEESMKELFGTNLWSASCIKTDEIWVDGARGLLEFELTGQENKSIFPLKVKTWGKYVKIETSITEKMNLCVHI